MIWDLVEGKMEYSAGDPLGASEMIWILWTGARLYETGQGP